MSEPTPHVTEEPAAEPDAAPPLDADPDKGSYRMLVALVALLLIGLVVAVVILRESESTEASGDSTPASSGAGGAKEPKVIMPDQEPGPLTPFTITTFDGQTLDSDSFLGKPLVINFWASWCAPCRKEMPAFQQVSDELAGKITVVGIASDDTEKDARQFATERGIRYTLAMEPEGLADGMGVFGLPSTFLVDAEGNVVEAHFGELTHASLTALISEKLGVSST